MLQETKQAVIKSISTSKDNGESCSYSSRAITNGWILTKTEVEKDKDGNTSYESTETYFKENPLDKNKIDMDKIKQAIGKSDEDGDEIV